MRLTTIPDREYRKGVVWAETLRLRRVKTLRAGYNVSDCQILQGCLLLTVNQSLENLFRETSETLKRVLLTYTDSILATATTQSSLATRTRSAIEKVNPERDQQLLAAPMPQLFKAAVPPQVRLRRSVMSS